MEINYELIQEDLIKFSRQNAESQSTHKPLVWILSSMMFAFIFADLFYLLISGLGNFDNIGQVFVSIFIRTIISFVIVGMTYLVAALMQQKAGQKIDSVENNGILCEHKIVFDENQFVEITDVNTTKHSWLSIGEIKELDDFVFINVNFVGTHFIPKRYFEDEKHIKEFIETAQYHQSSAKDKFNSSHLASFERESNTLINSN